MVIFYKDKHPRLFKATVVIVILTMLTSNLGMLISGIIEGVPDIVNTIIILVLICIIAWVFFKVGKWIIKLIGIGIALILAYILLKYVLHLI